MSFCNLCAEKYKTCQDPKRKIDNDIISRVHNLGFSFRNYNFKESATICRKCYQGIPAVEKAEGIIKRWNRSTSRKRKCLEPDTSTSQVTVTFIKESII